MSKLSFRARALDAARPLAVWLAEELPELPDYSAISRAVPQMPSGMEKEEECEHHLQRAICTGLIIPTPEVSSAVDMDFYERCYPPDYKMPKQLIHMQPLCLEQETPEYDMDTEDELWLKQHPHPELTELKFEEMMDRLERSSGQTVLQLNEAKLLLERDDDLADLVYDYWLGKRLKLQHPLIPSVRTESRVGQSASNPYLAFRRRTEKMQTRKNRKNDESSYEKMLKLRRELSRAASLLELVVRRERAKRELVRLARQLAERRRRAGDYAGQLLAELTARAGERTPTYPASAAPPTAPSYRREPYAHYAPRPPAAAQHLSRQRDKRQNKRRKHRHHSSANVIGAREAGYSSSEEEVVRAAAGARGARAEPETPSPPPDDGPYAFRRKPGVYYQMPTSSLCGLESDGYESPSSVKENVCGADKRHRFTLTSISTPRRKCIGFARRRVGRGGRVILDRITTPLDDVWPRLDYPYASSSCHRASAEDPERQRYRQPREVVRDWGGKHPWRRAYRRHCERSGVKSGRDGARAAEGGERDGGDDGELQPREEEFARLLDTVNKQWLHFRPATPPPCAPSPPLVPPPAGPLAVTLRPADPDPPSRVLTDYSPFTTSEFTLADLYGDVMDDVSPEQEEIDNFTGLTDAQVESILSDTDLKALAEEDLKDDRKSSIDLLRPDDADALLEELVKTEVPFLSPSDARGPAAGERRRRKDEGFGSTSVSVYPLDSDPVYLDPASPEPVSEVVIQPAPPKIEIKPPTLAPVVAPPKPEPKRKKDEVLEDVQVAQGVQLKTVHTKNSPLKKHIITASHREPTTSQAEPAVAVAAAAAAATASEPLKARLLGSGAHVVLEAGAAGAGGAAGATHNGPFGGAAVQTTRDGVTAVTTSTWSARRAPAPLLQHVAPGKLKVLHAHALTHAQRSQLLAAQRLPAVVSLASLEARPAPPAPSAPAALQLKTGQGAVAQFYEIKSGQLGRGPHVVNVVRQPADPRRRAPVLAALARPHRVSVLAGRHLVRAALPAAHQVRHQLQLKSRTLVASPQPPASIALAATSKAPALPGSVVANLLHKSAAAKAGHKVAIASGAPLASVQAFATFTHAQQIKARQARLAAPRPLGAGSASAELQETATTSAATATTHPAAADAADDAATNGGVRRRGDNLPMEVT